MDLAKVLTGLSTLDAPGRLPSAFGAAELRFSVVHDASASAIGLTTGARRTLLRGGSGALGFPRLVESLPEQAIGSGSNTLAGRARGRRAV